MQGSLTQNFAIVTSILLWVFVLVALGYGVVQTGIDAAALFTA